MDRVRGGRTQEVEGRQEQPGGRAPVEKNCINARETLRKKVVQLARLTFERFTHLDKGRSFELADSFFGQAQLLAQTFQCACLIFDLALGYDVLLAVAKRRERGDQP